jgi:hypothetical protein
MINKNSFGVGVARKPMELGINYPQPFETSETFTVPLKVDKQFSDVKTPPKHPF